MQTPQHTEIQQGVHSFHICTASLCGSCSHPHQVSQILQLRILRHSSTTTSKKSKRSHRASVSSPGHSVPFPSAQSHTAVDFPTMLSNRRLSSNAEAGPCLPAAFQIMPGDPTSRRPSLELSPWLGMYLQCGKVCDLVSQGPDAIITSVNLQPRFQLHQLLIPTSVVPRSQTGGLG